MSRGLVVCLWFILLGLSSFVNAQEPHTRDSLSKKDKKINSLSKSDTIITIKEEPIKIDTTTFNKPEFKPNSTKAVLLSAVFPGAGQFYNRKYWKLPIVYGGALGLTYAITWNGRVYNDYNQAYRDLITGSGTSYENYLKPGQTPESYSGGRQAYQDALKRKKDFYRRNRDLAIIAAVGVYALCMIDAYVDAQLYDFDMSEDLSMRFTPVVWGPTSYSKTTIGLQCSITF